jgi:hypothetical protein
LQSTTHDPPLHVAARAALSSASPSRDLISHGATSNCGQRGRRFAIARHSPVCSTYASTARAPLTSSSMHYGHVCFRRAIDLAGLNEICSPTACTTKPVPFLIPRSARWSPGTSRSVPLAHRANIRCRVPSYFQSSDADTGHSLRRLLSTDALRQSFVLGDAIARRHTTESAHALSRGVDHRISLSRSTPRCWTRATTPARRSLLPTARLSRLHRRFACARCIARGL